MVAAASAAKEVAGSLIHFSSLWAVYTVGRWIETHSKVEALRAVGCLGSSATIRPYPHPPRCSANQQDGVTTTLDGLRRGDAGEPIPRDSVPAASLFTNDFLP